MDPETASYWRFMDLSYFFIVFQDPSVLSQICRPLILHIMVIKLALANLYQNEHGDCS